MRKLIWFSFASDVHLDAFIADFFPKVHRQFTLGMQRTQKVSLLLEYEPDLERIVKVLCQRLAELPTSEQAVPDARKTVASKFLLGLCGMLLLTNGISILQLMKAAQPQHVSSPAATPSLSAQAAPSATGLLPAGNTEVPAVPKAATKMIQTAPNINVMNSSHTKIHYEANRK